MRMTPKTGNDAFGMGAKPRSMRWMSTSDGEGPDAVKSCRRAGIRWRRSAARSVDHATRPWRIDARARAALARRERLPGSVQLVYHTLAHDEAHAFEHGDVLERA